MPDKEEKPKHLGSENLIPVNLRTKEEQREIVTKGGIKSGEVRREKKKFRSLYAEVLSRKYTVANEAIGQKELTGDQLIIEVIGAIISRADAPSVSMIKEMR